MAHLHSLIPLKIIALRSSKLPLLLLTSQQLALCLLPLTFLHAFSLISSLNSSLNSFSIITSFHMRPQQALFLSSHLQFLQLNVNFISAITHNLMVLNGSQVIIFMTFLSIINLSNLPSFSWRSSSHKAITCNLYIHPHHNSTYFQPVRSFYPRIRFVCMHTLLIAISHLHFVY